MVRTQWQSLNGEWQFAAGASASDPTPVGRTLTGLINVPYPMESSLSGVAGHHDYAFYRRTFTVPAGWSGQRVLLNFGAVNWQSTVYVNGTPVGSHSGGYDAFSLDITSALRPGANELIVRVYSPVNGSGGTEPIGKQRLGPGGVYYTASSGIWQTVWLEPVPSAAITRLDMTPDLPGQALNVVVQGTAGQTATVTALLPGTQTVVGTGAGATGTSIRVPVPNPHLWSASDPYLYDLRVSLNSGDTVTSYFGMRSISIGTVGGVARPLLNGKFVFQMGTLDQGYWPDGLYTAPTDAALKYDIQETKALGFNLIRKHMKVEPDRWYYWADKLGILVWQDMPAMDPDVSKTPPSSAARTEFEAEFHAVVNQHLSSPSVISWTPFNEGWGEYDPARIATEVKGWDPSRLVDNMSGINCCGPDGGNGDLADAHDYTATPIVLPATSGRASVIGESGGFSLYVQGHDWNPSATNYKVVPDSATLTSDYTASVGGLSWLMTHAGLSAAVYTQITDVEDELNGLLTYDRQVVKVDSNAVAATNNALINGSAAVTGALPANHAVSLRVTNAGLTDRYVDYDAAGLGVTTHIDPTSAVSDKEASTFLARPGLASAACWSFESRSQPGRYLRHSNYRLQLGTPDGSSGFNADATFCAAPANNGGPGISLQSYNYPGRYLRHTNAQLYIASNGGPNPWDGSGNWTNDTSWNVSTPWYRDEVDVPVGSYQSIQVTTAGLTNRYVRQYQDPNDGGRIVGDTEVVTSGSDSGLKADATFRVVAGLADPTCVSLQSRTAPAEYLHNSGQRIRRDPNDGSSGFAASATWCTQAGLAGQSGTLSFASYTRPGAYLRHTNAQLWDSTNGGLFPTDATSATYLADASWLLTPPWAP